MATEVKCHTCGESFSVRPARTKRTKRFFCSKECQTSWMRTDEYKEIHANRNKKPFPYVICANCGISFFKSHRNDTKISFCCNDCRDKYNANKIVETMTQEKIAVNCKYCKKPKKVHLSVFIKNTNHFCSSECYFSWKKENTPRGKDSPFYNRVNVNCANCQKEMHVVQWKIDTNINHFCSSKCYYSYSDDKRNFNPKTKPQKHIDMLLQNMNIEYENEYVIYPYSIDNAIKTINNTLFIEINGGFWHTDIRQYKTNIIELQYSGILRDKRKNSEVKERTGVNILYLWEKDIIDNILLCEELIELYVFNDGYLENYHSMNYYLDNKNQIHINDDILLPYMDWDINEIQKTLTVKP